MTESADIAGLRRDVQALTGEVAAFRETVRRLVERYDAELLRQSDRTDVVEARLDDLPPSAVAAG